MTDEHHTSAKSNPPQIASQNSQSAMGPVPTHPAGQGVGGAIGIGSADSPLSARAALVDAQESDLWVGRTSFGHHSARLLTGGAIFSAASFFVVKGAMSSELLSAGGAGLLILAILIVTLALFAAPVFWTIISYRYRLTSQRLIIERGIFSQTIDQTELVRVDDIRIQKSLIDRVLGLGTVQVISTDSSHTQVDIPGIVGPEQVADALRNRMRALRQRSVFVEQL